MIPLFKIFTGCLARAKPSLTKAAGVTSAPTPNRRPSTVRLIGAAFGRKLRNPPIFGSRW